VNLWDSHYCSWCKAPARLVDITDGPDRIRIYSAVTVEHMPWCKARPGSELWNKAVEKLRASLTGRQRRW
jgi:hypothetical protein